MTYIRFRKGLEVQGIDRRSLPYHHWMQPFAAWYSTVLCLVVCLVRDFPDLMPPLGLINDAWAVQRLVSVPEG